MVALRDIPVGPSRHLVRFVEADGALWALKSLPPRVAGHEYEMLRVLEDLQLPAVRAAGVVGQEALEQSILVTHFLDRSWQYRRLLMRIPSAMSAHRGRLFDAMAVLLVDLHRRGIYWGDCSLANTLFMRDGQSLHAWLVDAETAEHHERLSDGQREMDLGIMVENVAGGLLDVAARRGDPPSTSRMILDEAHSVAGRYESLWSLLHDEPIVGLEDHYEIGRRLRRLNDAGFVLDEVHLAPAGDDSEEVRIKVTVAARSYHSEHLRRLTALSVGEGQATILLNDLRSFQTMVQHESGIELSDAEAAELWLRERFEPGASRAHRALGEHGDRTQAYCDLLEVRWLLSEQAGHDVGDRPALEALAARAMPDDSAASMEFVDLPTEQLPTIVPDR